MVKQMNPEKLMHRGFAHSRTQFAPEFQDTLRERALADEWEAENPIAGQCGTQPILNALVPDCSLRDARVAATVVQWLGSEVGFNFLQEALGKAGYEIVSLKKYTA